MYDWTNQWCCLRLVVGTVFDLLLPVDVFVVLDLLNYRLVFDLCLIPLFMLLLFLDFDLALLGHLLRHL